MLRPHFVEAAATILFPAASTGDDADDDEAQLEMDDVPTARGRLRYKQSCPALTGTASRILTVAGPMRHQQLESASLRDPQRTRPSASSQVPVIESIVPVGDMCEDAQAMPPPGRIVNRKRSALLADVINDVEGRHRKRLAICKEDTSEPEPLTDISVNTRPRQSALRTLKNRPSQFELLYLSSKQQPLAGSASMLTGPPAHDQTSEPEQSAETLTLSKQVSHALHSSQHHGRNLRSHPSLLSLHIEQQRSRSPVKRRLDDIDTAHLTSFDSLLSAHRPVSQAGPCLHAEMLTGTDDPVLAAALSSRQAEERTSPGPLSGLANLGDKHPVTAARQRRDLSAQALLQQCLERDTTETQIVRERGPARFTRSLKNLFSRQNT